MKSDQSQCSGYTELTAAVPSQGGGENMINVLIVEDQRMMRETMEGYIRQSE